MEVTDQVIELKLLCRIVIMRCLGYYGDSILCPCYNYYLISKYSFFFNSDDTILHSVNKLINLISIESYFLEVCAFGTLTTFTEVFRKV